MSCNTCKNQQKQKKTKELYENDGITIACTLIRLKGALVDILASESGCHQRFLLQNNYSRCNELQTHEKINRSNNKIKELDENDWNATTCTLIWLKSAFVNILALELRLHWHFELHNNYGVCNELQTQERINRNDKELKELEKMTGINKEAFFIQEEAWWCHYISFWSKQVLPKATQ